MDFSTGFVLSVGELLFAHRNLEAVLTLFKIAHEILSVANRKLQAVLVSIDIGIMSSMGK